MEKPDFGFWRKLLGSVLMDPQSFSDLEKKFCEIFGVYHLLETARKYDQPIYFFLKE